jgi:hypothetical protein
MHTCEPALVILALVATACVCHSATTPAAWSNTLKPSGTAAGPLTLAKDGATSYVIVIPAKPTSQDNKAAEDLALWLGKMTDATFAIVPDSTSPRDTEISIGRTNRLTDARVPQAGADLGNEGYAIGVEGQRLFLLGGKKRGAINAVYALLEEDFGCRWYSQSYTKIPHRSVLRFGPVPRSYVPRLMIRDPFYHDAFDATWSLHNRTNAPNAAVPEEWGGHVDYDGLFVHTSNTLVPPDQYFAKHPEYYMMSGGKRSPQQLCLTNPDVVRIATENLLRILKDNPNTEIVSVSPNDGGGHCTCPNCRAIDDANGSPSGTLITFLNQIAEAVEKVRPAQRRDPTVQRPALVALSLHLLRHRHEAREQALPERHHRVGEDHEEHRHLGLLRQLQPLPRAHAEHGHPAADGGLLRRAQLRRRHDAGGLPGLRGRVRAPKVVGDGEAALGSVATSRHAGGRLHRRLLRHGG